MLVEGVVREEEAGVVGLEGVEGEEDGVSEGMEQVLDNNMSAVKLLLARMSW